VEYQQLQMGEAGRDQGYSYLSCNFWRLRPLVPHKTELYRQVSKAGKEEIQITGL